MEQISYEELKKAYDDLSYMYEILQEKFHKALADGDALGGLRSQIIKKLQETNTLLIQQYEHVVNQNRSLQEELRKLDSGKSTK
jgi:hypothetical protein